MAKIPQITKLEYQLFELLQPEIASLNLTIALNFPRQQTDLTANKSLLVYRSINADNVEGRIVNPSILHPTISFVLFSTDYLQCANNLESLIEIIDRLHPRDFNLEGMRVDHLYKQRRTMPELMTNTELYMSSVDYKFFLFGLA